MSYSKSIGIAFITFVCATALAVDAGAQSRGGRSGGGSGGGHSAGRAPTGGGQRPSGRVAPRGVASAGTTHGAAVVVPGGSAYGGIRVQGAPRNAEVYVDGAYAGVVDDYDGVSQRLDLQPGSHEIEIRASDRPLVYDVNVTPGQTVTIHANVR